jgi:2-methylcitrate dehydratase PrpD
LITITEKFAEFVKASTFADFPSSAVEIAKLAILDNVGSILVASTTDVGKVYLNTKSHGVNGPCTIIGISEKASLMEACFINASLCQVLDFDDTFEINSVPVSHPGPAVVPAALSVGQQLNCSGKELIRSVILGYEAAIRVTKAIEPRRDEFWGFANTQIMGAVTAAAVLYDLDRKSLLNALGIAAASSPVPNTSMMWSLENRPMSWVKDAVGFAASTGVMSALLAKNGFTGPQNVLDQGSGYYLVCGSQKYKEEEIVKDLGKPFEIINLSFKPFPTCRFMHSTLDTVLALLKENNLGNEDIKIIEVYTTPSLSKFFSVYEPISMIDAQFSLPFAVAAILNALTPSALWYSSTTLHNPNILQTAKKVKLIPDDEVEKVRIDKMLLSPKVKIITTGGKVHFKQANFPRGNPHNPLTRLEVQEKFRSQLLSLMDEEKIQLIIARIDDLEKHNSISDFVSLLCI